MIVRPPRGINTMQVLACEHWADQRVAGVDSSVEDTDGDSC